VYTVPGVWQDGAMKPLPPWLRQQQAAERASKKKKAAREGGAIADLLRERRLSRAREQASGAGEGGKKW